jgi:hypothetical protein
MHGRAAADVEIKVPLGTIIKHVCARPHGYLVVLYLAPFAEKEGGVHFNYVPSSFSAMASRRMIELLLI